MSVHALPWRWLGEPGHPDGATLLSLARRHGGPLLDASRPAAAGQPFLLLAHGRYCLPALADCASPALCRAALLLQPDGDERGVRPLPFPVLVACHRPDALSARLTQAASLASAWQARLYLLQGPDVLQELAPLLVALQRLAAQPQLGDL